MKYSKIVYKFDKEKILSQNENTNWMLISLFISKSINLFHFVPIIRRKKYWIESSGGLPDEIVSHLIPHAPADKQHLLAIHSLKPLNRSVSALACLYFHNVARSAGCDSHFKTQEGISFSPSKVASTWDCWLKYDLYHYSNEMKDDLRSAQQSDLSST